MSNEIKIFKAEKEAGLEHAIKSNAAIAYHAPVLLDQKPPVTHLQDITSLRDLPSLTRAASDDQDVYKVYSVLVTTSWNKNDDVFDKSEVWAAKNTPKYKPTNIEHDERQIVGGIIDSWAVDDKFFLMEENVDNKNLPDHYHIVVASVIYKQWQDPAYQNRANNLITEIEAGEKYVSMECLFHGFDYAIVDPNGKHHVVARNDESAFLTSHLRAYGGKGIYQDHQVGRLLRNITFSGKGFVAKPANPESVIFDNTKVFDFQSASTSSKNMFSDKIGVITPVEAHNNKFVDTQESFDMSNDILNDQIRDLKEALEAAQADNKQLSDKLATANVEKYEITISELTEAATVAAAQVEKAEADLAEANSSIETITSDLEEKTQALEKAESYISEMKAAEKKRVREASLSEAGLSAEEAAAKMELFGDLSDDQFDALANTLAEYRVEASEEVEAEESEAEEAEAADTSDTEIEEEAEEAVATEVDEEILETVEADETVEASVEADESIGHEEIEGIRAGLQDWVNKVILNNELEK